MQSSVRSIAITGATGFVGRHVVNRLLEQPPPGPHPSKYARSTYLADQIGWRIHAERGLPLTVVHLAAVIGAGDPRPTMEVRRAVDEIRADLPWRSS